MRFYCVFSGFNCEGTVGRHHPFVVDLTTKRILQFHLLFFLKFFIILSYVEFDLISWQIQRGKDTGTSHHKFEEVISIEDVLEGMFEGTLGEGFEDDGETTVGLSW